MYSGWYQWVGWCLQAQACLRWCQVCHQVMSCQGTPSESTRFHTITSVWLIKWNEFKNKSLFPLYNDFVLLVSGMPPPVGHRPGITHMAQVLPAANVLTRPVVPAASAPSAQPDVTKPLFPIAGQVKSLWHHFRLFKKISFSTPIGKNITFSCWIYLLLFE